MSVVDNDVVQRGLRLADLGTQAVREEIARHLANGRSVWIGDGEGGQREIRPEDPEAEKYAKYLTAPSQAAE